MLQTIEKLADMISDEICDMTKYAECAHHLKEKYPDVAEVLYTIGTQEERHMEMLQDVMDRIISNKGTVTPEVQALFSYVKKCNAKEYRKAKEKQKEYSN